MCLRYSFPLVGIHTDAVKTFISGDFVGTIDTQGLSLPKSTEGAKGFFLDVIKNNEKMVNRGPMIEGLEIIKLAPEELARWKSVTEPVIEGYVKDMISKGYSEKEIRGWIAFLRERIKYWTKKQISYYIKSATGPDETLR